MGLASAGTRKLRVLQGPEAGTSPPEAPLAVSTTVMVEKARQSQRTIFPVPPSVHNHPPPHGTDIPLAEGHAEAKSVL